MLNIQAQTSNTADMTMQGLVDVCLKMKDAISVGDRESMLKTAEEFKLCAPINFSSLKCIDSIRVSFNGHMIFDDVFLNAYANNRKIIEKTDSIFENYTNYKVRGQSPVGR